MHNLTEMVKEFHMRFNHPVGDGVRLLDWERQNFRMRLIAEEYIELENAAGESSLVDIVDALADLAYVTWGMAIEMGVNLEEVLEEVHRSNMTKLWGDGQPRYREDGKVLKPEGWTPPDIAGVLRRQGGELND